jgi:long-chain acyl-CoA synthetase
MTEEVVFKDFRNVHHMLEETVKAHSDEDAYRWFVAPGETEAVTWSQFLDQVHRVSRSLIALGVGKGDKVSILSYTCYRWVLADLAIASMGACTVGIYQSLLAEDCRYIIDHSDSVVLFAEDQVQLDKLLAIRDQIPRVRKVIMLKGDGLADDDWVISFGDFLSLGAQIDAEVLRQHIDAVTPEDPAAIVYTSGTTGVPKGAVLTNDNMTFTPQSALFSLDIKPFHQTFLFLPMAHVFARICVLFALLAGNPTTFTRSMETIVEDIKTTRPHWFASVPRVYEKVYSKVVSGAEAKGGLALTIFRWACGVGSRVSELKQQDKPLPLLTSVQYRLATKLVFSKIQAALGGNVCWCISGAAPLNPTIGRFFHAAGILILEGIGMTENTSFTNVNRVDRYRFGWVGPAGPGIEHRIADDGEVQFRGRNVMKEYYKMPEETAATLSEDGWQSTGDLGEIDAEGFLRITGRKKDLIITAGGKNIAPSAIEGSMATSKYIAQVCVVGDRRKHLSALITLDQENIVAFAQETGISYSSFEELMNRDEVITLINAEVQERNRDLATFETIKKVAVVPEFTIENGLLTPTMKVKRNVVIERHADLIEKLYAEED